MLQRGDSPRFLQIVRATKCEKVSDLIMEGHYMNPIRWSFVQGWTATPDMRRTNARMHDVWLEMPEVPHSRERDRLLGHSGGDYRSREGEA
jgi:hypothetical protein